MSENIEPTETLSQSNDQNTSARAIIEQHAEAADQNELLSFALSCVTDAIFTFDRSGIIVVCNRAAEELCGKTRSQIRGECINEVVSLVNEQTLDPYDNIQETFFHENGPKELRCIFVIDGVPERNVTVRGEMFPGRDGAENLMILLIRDCSQQEQLEEELLRVRKLESVGLLAGGIAHDFNNILTGKQNSQTEFYQGYWQYRL